MSSCPDLPETLLAVTTATLQAGGTVLFSACELDELVSPLTQLGPFHGAAQQHSVEGAMFLLSEAGVVVVDDDFVEFASDFPAPYDLRLQFNRSLGWNGARVVTQGARRYFTKPAVSASGD